MDIFRSPWTIHGAYDKPAMLDAAWTVEQAALTQLPSASPYANRERILTLPAGEAYPGTQKVGVRKLSATSNGQIWQPPLGTWR